MLTSIDYSCAPCCRLPREVPPELRDLPFVTQSVGSHIRTLVDPTHGWLALRGSGITAALCRNATGELSRAEKRSLETRVGRLQERDYLLRCRVFDADLGAIDTADKRSIAVSPWLEDPDGDWVVIRDWVPSERGLTCAETVAWHAARRARLQEHAATETADL